MSYEMLNGLQRLMANKPDVFQTLRELDENDEEEIEWTEQQRKQSKLVSPMKR